MRFNCSKTARKEANDEDMPKEKKKQLTQEEKEYKSLRKQIQDKLIKFVTRIPVFMYLTLVTPADSSILSLLSVATPCPATRALTYWGSMAIGNIS